MSDYSNADFLNRIERSQGRLNRSRTECVSVTQTVPFLPKNFWTRSKKNQVSYVESQLNHSLDRWC